MTREAQGAIAVIVPNCKCFHNLVQLDQPQACMAGSTAYMFLSCMARTKAQQMMCRPNVES